MAGVVAAEWDGGGLEKKLLQECLWFDRGFAPAPRTSCTEYHHSEVWTLQTHFSEHWVSIWWPL